jgi:hypothetical protein
LITDEERQSMRITGAEIANYRGFAGDSFRLTLEQGENLLVLFGVLEAHVIYSSNEEPSNSIRWVAQDLVITLGPSEASLFRFTQGIDSTAGQTHLNLSQNR